MWYFTSDFSRGDTAYTKLALDRHTDTTYFQEPCGYVLLLVHSHTVQKAGAIHSDVVFSSVDFIVSSAADGTYFY